MPSRIERAKPKQGSAPGYNSLNSAPTTPNWFLPPLKNREKFPELSPVIGVKNRIIEIEWFVETYKLIRMASRDLLTDL
jgi:hypothetical protein